MFEPYGSIMKVCMLVTDSKKIFLINKMVRLKYHDGSRMTDHLNNFQGIMNQLSTMGIKFDEEIQGLLLLGSHQTLVKHLELRCQILLRMV